MCFEYATWKFAGKGRQRGERDKRVVEKEEKKAEAGSSDSEAKQQLLSLCYRAQEAF